MRHNEVAPYFVVDEHMRIPELQMMSRSTWDILPEDFQKVFLECARLSANYERSVWKERVDISRKRVIEEGCQEFSKAALESSADVVNRSAKILTVFIFHTCLLG